jgi:5'-nucleotidase
VPLILLTNDDGVSADGIRSLEEFLRGLAEIVVVAPDRERSAVSHGLTLHSSLEATRLDPRRYSFSGTPADCIIYALTHVLPSLPDLVISGINHGANLGDDIWYSGTVAGAREAARHGIASLAVSQAYDNRPIRFREGARFIRSFVKSTLTRGPKPGSLLNINFPPGDIRGIKVTRQGCGHRYPHFNMLDDEAKAAEIPDILASALKNDLPLDYDAIMESYISITPLQSDQTDYAAAQAIQEEIPQIEFDRRIPRLGLIK